MSAKMNRLTLILAVLALMVLASCGGGTSDIEDPNGVRPSITALTRGAANVGEQLTVIGLNFGDTQSGGSVKLNELDFTVTDWSDTQIDVTVVAGMVSGIVVVTANRMDSQSQTQAQLFIPAAPAGQPVITGLIPDYGKAGDSMQVAGQGFGGDQGAGAVMFEAEDGTLTAAVVEVVDIGGLPITQWGNNSIKVTIPGGPGVDFEPGTYDVYVSTGTAQSNIKQYLLLPPDHPADAPVITDVTPGNGAVGTAITIAGDFFGHNQGTSQLTIGGVALDIVAWSYTVINAIIPAGAESGPLVIKVGDHEEQIWPPGTGGEFVVANEPVITGVTPSGVRMGRSMTVYGRYFGATQGEGTVRVGGTAQTAAEWHPTTDPDIHVIEIPSIAPFSAAGTPMNDGDGNPILDDWGNPMLFFEVVITADNGLASAPEYVSLVTNLKAVVTVDPLAGQRMGAGAGEDGTVFMFRPEVSGGSGNYEFTLIPDAEKPGVTSADQDPATVGVIEYTYPVDANANDEENYDTMMRIEDLDNGDSIVIEGPQLLVVKYGVPVITKMGVYDFNNGGLPAPNEWCYLVALQTYNDFAYLGDSAYFTSSRGDLMVGGNPLPHYVRNIGSFMIDGDNPRAQGYRYYNDDATNTNDGAVIALQGLNFGEATGELWLNAVGVPFQVTEFATGADLLTGWSDTEIRYFVPGGTFNLSGTVQVKPAGSTIVANSYEPMTCSAYVLGVAPDNNVSLTDGTITLTGFDFQPNSVPDKIGTEEYGMWMVRATYADPWGAGNVTNYGLLTTPVAPSTVAGTAMQFEMADLDVDGNGTVPVEVLSASGTESAVVEGTLEAGDYFFFLWTGAITMNGDFLPMAHSGIFSEAFQVGVTIGPVANVPPVASLSANPTSNNGAPLTVTFNASASTDPDGNIVDYEWDFDGNGTYNEAGDEAAAQGNAGPHNYTYTTEDTFTARVRVTDDGIPVETDVATASISTMPGGAGNTIRVNVVLRDWETFDATAQTMVRLYDGDPTAGGTPVNQFALDHVAAGAGNAATCLFEDVPDGTDYYIRFLTTVMHWDGEPTPPALGVTDIGPYGVPPDQVINKDGFQYREPPMP